MFSTPQRKWHEFTIVFFCVYQPHEALIVAHPPSHVCIRVCQISCSTGVPLAKILFMLKRWLASMLMLLLLEYMKNNIQTRFFHNRVHFSILFDALLRRSTVRWFLFLIRVVSQYQFVFFKWLLLYYVGLVGQIWHLWKNFIIIILKTNSTWFARIIPYW